MTEFQTPDGSRKPRGRPAGWRMPTLADIQGLTIEDFSFVRGVVSGMSPRASFLQFYANRYFDVDGVPIIPHGLEINHRAAQLEQQILQAGLASASPDTRSAALALQAPLPEDAATENAKVHAHMDYTVWLESLPEDMYGENELQDRYKDYLESEGGQSSPAQTNVITRAKAIEAKVKAINRLQTLLAAAPQPYNPVELWLAKPLSKALKALNVTTMGEFTAHIAQQGRHWHRKIKGLGPGRAFRVESWLDDHAQSLGAIDRTGQQWAPAAPIHTDLKPLQQVANVVELEYELDTGIATPRAGQLQRRFGIVPLEMLMVPTELDGHNGLFRTTTPNHLGARNDLQALLRWLNSYLAAGKIRTLEAYRREAERFYLWCLLEAQCPLSSVGLSHAQRYQVFLRNIPEQYTSTARVSREDPRWRPWRGQLTSKSRNYAIGVVSQLYTSLHRNAYVTGNPFNDVKPEGEGEKRHAMDTTRTLHAGDLELVRQKLASLPGLESKDLLHAALARRSRLILHLALTTGLRLAEMASTNLSGLRPAIVDGSETDEWMITVMGKGSKPRDVPLSNQVLAYIHEHHADWELLMPTAVARLREFKKAPPLIAALQAPVGAKAREITDETVLAHDNAALSRAGLALTLKTFFRQLAREVKSPKQSERIAKFSTHWLRHTFAHEVLRANPGDEGLKLAQQLLGHASIATTGEYVKQDESAKVRAVRKINPLGA